MGPSMPDLLLLFAMMHFSPPSSSLPFRDERSETKEQSKHTRNKPGPTVFSSWFGRFYHLPSLFFVVWSQNTQALENFLNKRQGQAHRKQSRLPILFVSFHFLHGFTCWYDCGGAERMNKETSNSDRRSSYTMWLLLLIVLSFLGDSFCSWQRCSVASPANQLKTALGTRFTNPLTCKPCVTQLAPRVHQPGFKPFPLLVFEHVFVLVGHKICLRLGELSCCCWIVQNLMLWRLQNQLDI